jgi:two-component system OmpR family sensor kinase
MRSIERMLLAWVLGALTLGAAALVGVSYWLTFQELGEVFDENLKQVALATAYRHGDGRNVAAGRNGTARPATPLPSLPRIYDSEGNFDFITLVWERDGHLIFTSDPSVSIPFFMESGLREVSRADGNWHIYSIVERNVIVQAAQRESSRALLAAEVASKMFVPLAALVVLIGLLLVFALRRGLRPLDEAAVTVTQRTIDSLVPVSTDDLPREIYPLVVSINDLMSRLSIAFATQRRFVADAAHELRTPVTALRLQLQLLERARDDASRDSAVRDLKAGVERSQHLIEQLLTLSRFEPDGTTDNSPLAPTLVPTDLGSLVRDVVTSMSIKAEHRGIDLGAQTIGVVSVHGDREQLLVLLNNLVENALRHAPRGGIVDVRATSIDGRPSLQVVDNGPGIAEAERERVFDRFYRGEAPAGEQGATVGSGLGLAIVQAIAERHRAKVSLHAAPIGSGLDVRVVFVEG